MSSLIIPDGPSFSLKLPYSFCGDAWYSTLKFFFLAMAAIRSMQNPLNPTAVVLSSMTYGFAWNETPEGVTDVIGIGELLVTTIEHTTTRNDY